LTITYLFIYLAFHNLVEECYCIV